jgi:hypothetical protein
MSLGARLPILALAALVGCGSVASRLPGDAGDALPPADAAPPTCDPMARFDPPQPLLGPEVTGSTADAALSADELTLYMTRLSPAGDGDLYVASRSAITESFSTPAPLAMVNSAANDAVPTLAAAGLALVFWSNRIANEGLHLYVASRTTELANFGAPELLAGVQSPVVTDDDWEPFATADGTELWFISNRGGNNDIYRAVKAGGGFVNPAIVPELNSPVVEEHVVVSADRKTVYFASTRSAPGTLGGTDIFRAHRTSVSDGFGPPAVVAELNTPNNDFPRWLSADNCRMYLHALVDATTGYRLFVATRHPAP